MTHDDFISSVAAAVKKYAPQYGIKVNSPVIAQAILESGWGESKLAAVYHNYFGLKCGSKWKGRSVNMKTMEEYTVGMLTAIRDNFRVYDDLDSGVKGYFEFIQASRYANLKGITDPLQYLETIKADGYATSSGYVNNLWNVIVANSLTKFDESEEKNMGKDAKSIIQQMQSWIGCNEADGSHKKIIDLYNSHKPLARGYKVKYTDAWCATTVSAAAIACGCTDIIPPECGCPDMIALFQKIGEWDENDGRVPDPGDVIFYDWQDSGSGDDTGTPDHVGVVEKVSGNSITVIEGNYHDAVGRRTLKVNDKFIRGYGVPAYDAGTVAPVQPDPAPEAAKNYLQKGDKGAAVKDMQTRLINAGYSCGKAGADGDFGSGTESGLIAFQKAHNLEPDGIYGPLSKAALEASGTAKSGANGFDEGIAGKYKTTANLRLRKGPGMDHGILAVMPVGSVAHNYGYYQDVNGERWLYLAWNGQEGYASANFLEKI